jgi:hypothetical protein
MPGWKPDDEDEDAVIMGDNDEGSDDEDDESDEDSGHDEGDE